MEMWISSKYEFVVENTNKLNWWIGTLGASLQDIERSNILSIAAYFMCRLFQLDFIEVFLQAEARDQVFTILSQKWAKVFPDLDEWQTIRKMKSN